MNLGSWKTYFAFLPIYFLCLSTVSALYEDQVGKFDWRQQYVGKVTHAFFDKSSSGKKLVVGTEQNVIALLNGSSGKLLWRYLLGSRAKLHSLFPIDNGKFISVSGSPAVARVWDTNSGILIWENPVSHTDDPIFSAWGGKEGNLHAVEIAKNAEGQFELTISRHSVSSSSDETKKKVQAVWFNEGLKCEFVFPNLVCLDEKSKMLSSVNIESAENVDVKSLRDLGIDYAEGTSSFGVTRNTEASQYFWVKASDKVYVLTYKDGLFSVAFSLKSNAEAFDVASINEENKIKEYFVALESGNDGYSLEFYDLDSGRVAGNLGGPLKFPSAVGKPEIVSLYMFKKQQKELSYRYAISTEDLTLFCGISAEVSWTREESLASISAVEMVDFPVSETEASIEEEFSLAKDGILSHVIKRMTSQFSQILIAGREIVNKMRGGNKSAGSSVSADLLVRDRFGLHKMIIVMTTTGKIFGMETTSGKIIWKNLLKGVSVQKAALYIQRTTAHFPLEPQCIILTKDISGSKSVLYVFHPITGEPVGSSGYIKLDYNVQQATLLPQNEETEFVKPLLLLDESGKAHIYPDNQALRNYITSYGNSLFIYSADPKACLLRGFLVSGSDLTTVQVWQLQLCSAAGEEITTIVGRKADEKVFSQGRVLADRSVLYKYLNPNLVVVVVEGWTPSQKGYAHVYLVDTVSGAVVFSTVHKRVSGPIHVAHAENWVVYSYYNEKFRRIEIASLEMFEGKEQSNSTSFSSFAAPQPMINRQAYIYPAYITTLADTFTEKGMASKHLLVGLVNGWIQELPRVLLDPRRPVVSAATQEMREEGTVPYVPELPIPSEAIINYNQTVAHIRKIHTTPSALESTSLVLAYGLDLYFTRVTPSKTFDVLKDDFEYFFISTVVLGLFVASYIAKRVASKKSLKQAWK